MNDCLGWRTTTTQCIWFSLLLNSLTPSVKPTYKANFAAYLLPDISEWQQISHWQEQADENCWLIHKCCGSKRTKLITADEERLFTFNTSSSVTGDMSHKLIDCYGNEYQITRMPGTGFCGFHCLSFCLSGNQLNYADIIHDCINVFTNIPEPFNLRTIFGVQDDSSSTLNDLMVAEEQCRPVSAVSPPAI